MTITVMTTEDVFATIHREYGGSSFSAALFDRGYSDMPSAWSIWAHFSGKLEDLGPDEETNARVRIGKAIEPVIAAEVSHKMGWDLIDGLDYHQPDAEDGGEGWSGDYAETPRIFVHHPDKNLKIGCTVDRYVREHEDGPGIIECKNRDWMQWIDSYTDDDASIRDRIQLAHQFACHPQITWGAIAALVGGNDLKLYIYKREALADMIQDVEARWRMMFSFINDKVEPTLTGSELPNWLRVHDEGLGVSVETLALDDSTNDAGMTFDQISREYLDASALRKENEKIEKNLKAQIVQRLDERRFGRSNIYKVRATYSKVSASVMSITNKFKLVLLACLDLANEDRDMETGNIINQIINDGGIRTREGHTRVTLKFDEDPMTDQGPTDAEKKAAYDAQAPLEQEPAKHDGVTGFDKFTKPE